MTAYSAGMQATATVAMAKRRRRIRNAASIRAMKNTWDSSFKRFLARRLECGLHLSPKGCHQPRSCDSRLSRGNVMLHVSWNSTFAYLCRRVEVGCACKTTGASAPVVRQRSRALNLCSFAAAGDGPHQPRTGQQHGVGLGFGNRGDSGQHANVISGVAGCPVKRQGLAAEG